MRNRSIFQKSIDFSAKIGMMTVSEHLELRFIFGIDTRTKLAVLSIHCYRLNVEKPIKGLFNNVQFHAQIHRL